MTFEASRKKQVLVLQPRGKALYEDDSSFGSRMLAKMGWNKGQGLGKEQHGNLEFIQIRYKNNANGLGYDGLKDNQWTENESQFDDLLKKLNGSSSSNNEDKNINELRNVKSLEEKSKRSRARVHYKKFTRGKDVHSYSEKDLANILGKKTLKRNDQTTDPVSQNTFEEKSTPSPSNSNNMIIESGLSVTDYFKQKMKSKHSETSLESSPAEETTENEKISKSKKRKIIQEEAEASDNDEIRISLNIYESNTQNIEKPKKKKKRHLAQIEVVSFDNNELKDKQDTIDEQKELSSNVMKKKSKKPKNEEITNEDTSLKQIKARKSKKSKDIANNHNLENENTELSEQ
ncbi:CLUMA_CG003293, isoform A, partial [Clunio marinus]